jgi:hypothetical protein
MSLVRLMMLLFSAVKDKVSDISYLQVLGSSTGEVPETLSPSRSSLWDIFYVQLYSKMLPVGSHFLLVKYVFPLRLLLKSSPPVASHRDPPHPGSCTISI